MKDEGLVEMNLDNTMDGGIVAVDVNLWKRKSKKKFKDLNSTVSSLSILSESP